MPRIHVYVRAQMTATGSQIEAIRIAVDGLSALLPAGAVSCAVEGDNDASEPVSAVAPEPIAEASDDVS